MTTGEDPPTAVGSDQDGEDPDLRRDMVAEIAKSGHGGAGGKRQGSSRVKNREVENEMVVEPERDGEPPIPATEPTLARG